MKNKNAQTGAAFCVLLTAALTAAKLCGWIGWGWLWVLAPLWLPMAAGAAGVLLVAGYGATLLAALFLSAIIEFLRNKRC